MLKFSGELEDVCFTAERNNEWSVKLFPSQQAKTDFPEKAERQAELVLNDEEMGALLFLMATDDCIDEVLDEMYAIIEPKLKEVPNFLRPIP